MLERCRQSLQYRQISCCDHLPFSNLSGHPLESLSKHRLYAKLPKLPEHYLVIDATLLAGPGHRSHDWWCSNDHGGPLFSPSSIRVTLYQWFLQTWQSKSSRLLCVTHLVTDRLFSSIHSSGNVHYWSTMIVMKLACTVGLHAGRRLTFRTPNVMMLIAVWMAVTLTFWHVFILLFTPKASDSIFLSLYILVSQNCYKSFCKG